VARGYLVKILVGDVEGELNVPAAASGVVIFAHGSGSSRHSPRNRYVAEVLRQAGLATMLLDLSDADRLVAATQRLSRQPQVKGLKIGYFGASSGAGVALVAAAEIPDLIHAVVSRGGRIDLAGEALDKVQSPTLAIVGGDDSVVLELNRAALAQMRCPKRLEIIPGAGHLFSEPGALEQVATRARAWFTDALAASRARVGAR
jgi:putative phosphoribosyl transferase